MIPWAEDMPRCAMLAYEAKRFEDAATHNLDERATRGA